MNSALVIVLTLISQCIFAQPDSEIASSLCALYSYYTKAGQRNLAKKYYELAIKEGSRGVFFLEGCEQLKKNNLQKATLLFKKASESQFVAEMVLCLIDGNIKGACTIFNEYRIEADTNQTDENFPDWTNNVSQESVIAGLFYNMGKYKDAELYLKKALGSSIGERKYCNLADFYKKQRRYDLAVEFYKKAIENGEKNYATDSLGAIYYKQGKLDLAQQFYESEAAEYSFKKSLYLALIQYSKGNIQLGARYLLELGIAPTKLTNPIKVKQYAKKQMSLNMEAHYHHDVGLAYFEAKRYQEALPYLLKSYDRDRDMNSYSLIWIGKIYRKLMELDLAQSIYKKIENKYPRDAYIGMAKVYEQRKDYINALAYYQKVFEFYAPGCAKALAHIIKIHIKLDNKQEAENQLKKFLEIADYIPLFNLGLYFHQNNDFHFAKKLYKKSFEKEKTYGALINLARIYLIQGKFKKAKPLLKKTLSLGDVGAGKDLVIIYSRENKTSKAIELLKHLILMKPDSDMLYNLACLLEHSGQLEEAKEYYRKATSMGSLCAYGKISQFDGDFDHAEECYKRAIKGKKYHAYYLLYILYEKLGKTELAQEYLETARKYGYGY
jgi:tetratricopeptide (TPR) repeat protein